jgi:hypothetical protein
MRIDIPGIGWDANWRQCRLSKGRAMAPNKQDSTTVVREPVLIVQPLSIKMNTKPWFHQ